LRIGLYDAYLATLGGGENLLAAVAECLEREFPRATVEILSHGTGSTGVADLVQRFGVDLRRTKLRLLPVKPRAWSGSRTPLRRLLAERDISRVTAEYDLFINHTIFSLVPPRARRSIYVCMFPLDPVPPSWRGQTRMLRRPWVALYVALRRHTFRRYLARYDVVFGISEFTRRWIGQLWDLRSRLLYPPVETEESIDLRAKTRRILAIGRFFPGDHNKKHHAMIEVFESLCRGGMEDWELHLAGGWTDVSGTRDYVDSLRRAAEGLPIHFHIDCDRVHLRELLRTSAIFWHATGLDEAETVDPYKLEHFGMSTVEAMTHGCVPLIHASGGQKEIVEDGVSGFLWQRREELQRWTLRLAGDATLRGEMALKAHEHSQRYSRRAFRESLRAVLHETLPASWLTDGGETS
jgi:glycosyltransferase involved in cell wall biosynthesis